MEGCEGGGGGGGIRAIRSQQVLNVDYRLLGVSNPKKERGGVMKKLPEVNVSSKELYRMLIALNGGGQHSAG